MSAGYLGGGAGRCFLDLVMPNDQSTSGFVHSPGRPETHTPKGREDAAFHALSTRGHLVVLWQGEVPEDTRDKSRNVYETRA